MNNEVKLIEDWRERWEVKANWDVVAVAETPIGIRVWASYKDYPISTYPKGEILIPKSRPKTYRPWKREEVPVGSVVRHQMSGNLFLITGACDDTMCINGDMNSYDRMFECFVLHRTTESGEWVPVEQCPKCGVEE